MRRAIIWGLFIIIFSSYSFLYSQEKKTSFELSVSGNFGSFKQTVKAGGRESEIESRDFGSLSFRFGYFIISGLEIEPEIFWTAIEKELPVFYFVGNLAYNFIIPGYNVSPFVLVGYGVGNSTPLLQRVLLFRESDEMDVKLLNFGGGIKFFVTDNVALRIEYRYQRYSREEEVFRTTREWTQSFHNFFLGFSVFLK
jgi:hypothetical protein